MVAGDALVCTNRGSVHIGVCRASRRLTVGTVGAAVGGFAVEPNQPSAIDFGDLGDFAACYVGDRAFAVGSNTGISKRRCHRVFTVNGDIQRFSLRAAVGRGVNQLRGKIRIRLHIHAQRNSGGFAVFAMQQTFGIFGGLAVVVQQSHTVRQNQINGAAVGGVLHLRQNRHNGVVGIFQQGRCQRMIVTIQRLGAQIAILFQIGIPRAKPDFGFASRHRQAIAAKVGACGGIRHILIQNLTVKGVRLFFFSLLVRSWYRVFLGSCTGVGAALVGLPIVGFRRLGLLLHLHGFLGGLRCGFLRKRCTGQHGAEHYRRRKQRGNAMLQFIMCFFHCEILSKQRFFHEKKRLQNADAAVIFRGYLGRAGLLLFQIFALGLQNRPIGRYALVGQRSNRNGQIHGDPYL